MSPGLAILVLCLRGLAAAAMADPTALEGSGGALVTLDEGCSPTPDDDPINDDDGDPSDADMVTPSRIDFAPPSAAMTLPGARVVLHDEQCTSDQLFRPPRVLSA